MVKTHREFFESEAQRLVGLSKFQAKSAAQRSPGGGGGQGLEGGGGGGGGGAGREAAREGMQQDEEV